MGSVAKGAFPFTEDAVPKTKDRTPRGEGRSAAFQLRIPLSLHQQLRALSEAENVTLGRWLKELARRELRRRGIDPQG